MLVGLSLSFALAADPEFAGTVKDGKSVEKPEGHLTAEFGGALTTGNSEFYTLTAGLKSDYRWGRSKLALMGGAVAGSSRVDADADGTLSPAERSVPMQANARRIYADARYDLFLSGHDSLYVLAGAFHDPFAGYDSRTHEQLGYSRMLVKNDDTKVVAEIGVDWAQENYVELVDPNYKNIIAARGMLGLNHKFSDHVGFDDTLEVYENVIDFEDLRVLNTASLVSTLSSKLSLKLSHTLIFDNVPVTGFRKTDQTMQVTLVASIL
ncbi:MAG: DUF481 domain-containing protein [Myxococcota bacterium]